MSVDVPLHQHPLMSMLRTLYQGCESTEEGVASVRTYAQGVNVKGEPFDFGVALENILGAGWKSAQDILMGPFNHAKILEAWWQGANAGTACLSQFLEALEATGKAKRRHSGPTPKQFLTTEAQIALTHTDNPYTAWVAVAVLGRWPEGLRQQVGRLVDATYQSAGEESMTLARSVLRVLAREERTLLLADGLTHPETAAWFEALEDTCPPDWQRDLGVHCLIHATYSARHAQWASLAMARWGTDVLTEQLQRTDCLPHSGPREFSHQEEEDRGLNERRAYARQAGLGYLGEQTATSSRRADKPLGP